MMSRTAPAVYDALVIGGGPAGLSTALTLARVCRSSIVFDSGEYRNRNAKEIHTYLSRDGIPPDTFRAISRQQIEDKYSDQVSFMTTKIVEISKAEILPGYKGFRAVDNSNNTYLGRKLVLATGTEDILPTDIEGYKENWPQHMQKDYPIGMLTFPNPSYASFALMALPFNKDFTIYSNGPVPTDEPTQAALKKVLASGIKLDQRKVRRLINNGEGPENGISIEFERGPPAKLGMLLHRPPTRSRGHALIDQLELETKPNGDVVTDQLMLRTNVPGCFAAGDTQESIKQALMAGSNGLRVGASIVFQLADEDGDRAVAMLQEQEANL
ncbi:fad-dependent pyridine nucleotide-disulfide oxidoreductase [Trichoderma cornu-damae]|uniref:Fad-dependent pyridine nucleotide-disulfide oxidoreductase n=1 Tax=Trichoderma cornu-damae TaxID=654480 RepID=A0A9P8QK07_9HYPO|nr:fad-dependent pyridine nucleotide-disulfide oxidoreductase [Trichoderma cornu-damae]